ncbi:DMT family transporter [Thalassotalea castellviae]|uniref:DMT family transporter n=1 Tax=Thalassotalea castellviae TaxID=3075612 RepID=A0ABU3A5X0_9GAMM|nr:DMT family transporter [Thalassotalea sp. W431]MDT0604483.1 DMT family transporter [Thalassotalea sp. W431]
MNVSTAYIAVVLIWSTTPLGIVWSSESVHPTLAVLLRMLIALILGLLLIKINRISLPWHRDAVKLYLFSALGIFGGMLLSYYAAQYISSGLISLIFGLAPILSGVIAQKLIHEPKFTLTKKIALVVALIGLFIVCLDNLLLSQNGYIGIILVLFAVLFFSLSGVLVKSITITIHPLSTTIGALLLCTPLFLLVWLIFDGSLNYQQWQLRSILAIVYLGVFGSLIGFIAYFYVLQKLTASTVALITMITPVLALSLGALLNNEHVSFNLMIGAVFVVTGLTCFQWSTKVSASMKKRLRNSHTKTRF